MGNKTKLIIFIALCLALIIVIILLIRNIGKSKLKNKVSKLQVRFNDIKTVPLAFKFNRAEDMARHSENISETFQEYYDKYEQLENHFEQIVSLLNGADDAIASRSHSQAKEAIRVVEENIDDAEEEVKEIEKFLESFAKREAELRDYLTSLKEEFYMTRQAVNANMAALNICYDPLMEKVGVCEELFSAAEDDMCDHHCSDVESKLELIKDLIKEINICNTEAPELVLVGQGVLPDLLDEVSRRYALMRQRGLNTDALKPDTRLEAYRHELNDINKELSLVNTAGLAERLATLKDNLNDLLAGIDSEEAAYNKGKELLQISFELAGKLDELCHYIAEAVKNDGQRLGFDELTKVAEEQAARNQDYRDRFVSLNMALAANKKPASEILGDIQKLNNECQNDLTARENDKKMINQNSSLEEYAHQQLMKLQLILNETEILVAENHLPALDQLYYDHLKTSKEKVEVIKKLLQEVPLKIEALQGELEETIDFVYQFYNNINQVVQMARAIEKITVECNKYRSTYPEIDQELSKVEYFFLKGEYTNAISRALNCVHFLSPKKEEKLLENI